MRILRSNSENQHFINLVGLLDADLAEKDGEDHAFYSQYNKIDNLKHTLVLYINKKPVAIGAMKQFDSSSMEIKRMFTLPNFRKQGFGIAILDELESWAKELGYKSCVLETGKRQPEAIQLYLKKGYKPITNYGQYKGIENSLCFKKLLN